MLLYQRESVQPSRAPIFLMMVLDVCFERRQAGAVDGTMVRCQFDSSHLGQCKTQSTRALYDLYCNNLRGIN